MGEEDSFLSSCVLDISSFTLRPRPKKMAPATQSMIGYDEGTYSATFMRVSKQGMNLPETDQGRGK